MTIPINRTTVPHRYEPSFSVYALEVQGIIFRPGDDIDTLHGKLRQLLDRVAGEKAKRDVLIVNRRAGEVT